MTTDQRVLFRLARRLHDRLMVTHAQRTSIELSESTWAECRQLLRLIAVAESRGWPAAGRQLRERLHSALAYLRCQIDTALAEVVPAARPRPQPSLRQVWEELQALHAEFDEVTIDLKEETVTVRIEEIVLEEVALGRFDIRLMAKELGSGHAYEVIAVDPHPAPGNSETTHPHVQNDHLCEGEGRLPIRQALREGRLSDFFVIVAQILKDLQRRLGLRPAVELVGPPLR